jgi:hypothetical protein
MGRSPVKFDEETIATRIKLGYGQGTGVNYKPWLTFRDISSRGITTRFASRKLRRTVTLFSNIERNAFLAAEFLRQFEDYHEQGPMPREITTELAAKLGIPHPRYFASRVPALLTYDGLLFRHGQRPVLIDCKHSGAGGRKARDQEGFALRHAYADHMGYKVLRIDDTSYSTHYIHNLQWMRTSAPVKAHFSMPEPQMEYWATKLMYFMVPAIERGECCPVRDFVHAFASTHGQSPGLALVWLRRLLLERHFEFDLEVHHSVVLQNPLFLLRPQLTKVAAKTGVLV